MGVGGGCLYRGVEILNSGGVAALVLLVAKPSSAFDTSFQLSFLAIGCIAGVAVPWMERHVQPYVGALHGWRDVTRDGAFSARQVQFRLGLRAAPAALASRFSARNAEGGGGFWGEGLGGSPPGGGMIARSAGLRF